MHGRRFFRPAVELEQNRVLRIAQAGWAECVVVELRQAPRRFANRSRDTGSIGEGFFGVFRHANLYAVASIGQMPLQARGVSGEGISEFGPSPDARGRASTSP